MATGLCDKCGEADRRLVKIPYPVRRGALYTCRNCWNGLRNKAVLAALDTSGGAGVEPDVFELSPEDIGLMIDALTEFQAGDGERWKRRVKVRSALAQVRKRLAEEA